MKNFLCARSNDRKLRRLRIFLPFRMKEGISRKHNENGRERRQCQLHPPCEEGVSVGTAQFRFGEHEMQIASYFIFRLERRSGLAQPILRRLNVSLVR